MKQKKHFLSVLNQNIQTASHIFKEAIALTFSYEVMIFRIP